MSREVIIKVRDDLDGSDADETIGFAYRGVDYEIDLSEANVERLDKSLAEFIEVARTVEPVVSATPLTKSPKAKRALMAQRRDIRSWATQHGFTVSVRGAIARPIIDAYRAANPLVELLPEVLAAKSGPKGPRPDTDAVTAQQADEEGLISASALLTSDDRTARDPSGRPLTKEQRDAVRSWANENDLDQPWTGQIRVDVLEAYFAAKKKGSKRGH